MDYGNNPEKEGLIQRITQALTRRDVPQGQEPDLEAAHTQTTQIGRNMGSWFDEIFGASRARLDAYRDYDDMEADSPIVCSALDAVADTAVAGAEGEAENVFEVTFEKENARASSIWEDLDQRTQLRSDSWSRIRTTQKRGDHFREVVIDPRLKPASISSLKPLPARSMRVVTEEERLRRKIDHGFEQHDPNTGQLIAKFAPWQVVHFAQKVEPEDVYGRSMLFSSRRTYSQLQMIEDALVVNRLTRATMRYVRKIPVPGLSAQGAYDFIEKLKAKHKRTRRFDPTTGKLLLTNNPLSEETDFWVPVTKEGQGDVSVLQGQQGQDRIEDVNHFVRKMFSSLRVPSSYIGWDQDTSGKAQAVTLDIAFARLVRRAQMVDGVGVRHIFDIELALHGMDPSKVDYDLFYAPIATTDEMRRWQIELLKVQVAAMMKEKTLVLDDEYLLRNVLEVEEEHLKVLIKKAKEEKAKQDKLAREAAKTIPGAGGVPGGQPAGEKGPPKNDPGREPPQRGGDASRQEAIKRLDASLRSRGVCPPRRVDHALRTALHAPSFIRELKEMYKLTTPMKVTRKDAPVSDKAKGILLEMSGAHGE